MSSTDLIRNADGSVYHLALHPQEVSNTIITVGDPERVFKVSQHFDNIEVQRNCWEFVTHTGSIGNNRLTVISTGIGTDNVDIVLNELHYLHKLKETDEPDLPMRFIRLGTSGAVREDIGVDKIMISEAAIGLDALLHFYPWQNNQEEIESMLQSDEQWCKLPRPYGAFAGKELYRDFLGISDFSGVSVTTPGFYAPQGRSVNIPACLPDFINLLSGAAFAGRPVTNIEMETAGIYGLSALLGHQAVSISAILANRLTGEFSNEPDKTIERMISLALEKIGKL